MNICKWFLTCFFCCFLLNVTGQNSNLNDNIYFFPDVLNIKNVPQNERDGQAFVFSDLGAWHGYALPDKDRSEVYGGFIGPRFMGGKKWISKSLSRLNLTVDGEGFNFFRNCKQLTYFPGRLVQKYGDERLQVEMELIFVSDRTALINTKILNNSDKKLTLSLSWSGDLLNKKADISPIDNGIKIYFPKVDIYSIVKWNRKIEVSENDKKIICSEQKNIILSKGENYEETIAQSVVFGKQELYSELKKLPEFLKNYNSLENNNYKRWNRYFKKVFSKKSSLFSEEKYCRLAVKTINTLLTNWRSPAADMLHDGIIPSYAVGYFDSFWAWDSWKHAAALALFDTDLAQNQVLAMFDYQDEYGMIPDLVGINKKWNNWRDTKPPLAAWAVYNILKEGGSIEFVEELLPKLLKYHYWWYDYRDNDKNGLCEFGSTDGTLEAAAWESGMDNAVRFDSAVMINNGKKNAWSINQESVDLNSFLYAEKIYLTKLLIAINKKEQADKLQNEAEKLKILIQEKMYDQKIGFFFDKLLKEDSLITVMGPEGWLPLWAGVADYRQAENIADKMVDPRKFNSYIPLGTLAVDHEKLQPYNGYWRGPVWIDQVYFGIKGLEKYKFDKLAKELLLKYLNNAQGLLQDKPIHENYNPFTGEGLNAPHFSWSAALTLRLLVDE